MMRGRALPEVTTVVVTHDMRTAAGLDSES